MNSAPLPGVHISALSVAHMNLLGVAQLALPTSLHVTLPPTPSTHTPHPGDHSSSVNTCCKNIQTCVCGVDLGATRQATGENEPRQETTRPLMGRETERSGCRPAPWSPTPPGQGVRSRQGESWSFGDPVGQLGPQGRDWCPHRACPAGQEPALKGPRIMVVLLGLPPTRSISGGGLDGSPARGMRQTPLVAA